MKAPGEEEEEERALLIVSATGFHAKVSLARYCSVCTLCMHKDIQMLRPLSGVGLFSALCFSPPLPPVYGASADSRCLELSPVSPDRLLGDSRCHESWCFPVPGFFIVRVATAVACAFRSPDMSCRALWQASGLRVCFLCPYLHIWLCIGVPIMGRVGELPLVEGV